MAEVKLEVTKREGTGKGVARRARAAGKVPGVVYGRGMDPVAIEVDRRAFVQALQTDAGLNVLLGLAGQISLGHAAFYAIGAYACAILTAAATLRRPAPISSASKPGSFVSFAECSRMSVSSAGVGARP